MTEYPTALEQEIIVAARHGAWVGLAGASVDELMTATSPERCVRAELIRELLIGRHGELDPHGIRIAGIRVLGLLDLDHVSTKAGLVLMRCAIPDAVTCRYARLREVLLGESRVSRLNADGLHTDGPLSLQMTTVRATDEAGAIKLGGAHIKGQLILNDIRIDNDRGPALTANGLKVDSDMQLHGATIRSADATGAIQMVNARIGGDLTLSHTSVVNNQGSALNANGIHVDGDLFLIRAELVSQHTDSALQLLGARIGGQANFFGATASSHHGPMLALSETHVEQTLWLPASLICPQERTQLKRPCPDQNRQITVTGLNYTNLRLASWRQWLHILVHHTPEYQPQPFQQLAKIERATGHDNNARTVLITQQNELHRRTPEALGSRLGRWRHRLWGWLGRYGYQAHRLVAVLGVVLVLAGGLAYAAGQVPTRPGHRAAERIAPANLAGTPCSTVELIGVGIDRGLPLGTTGLRARCDLDTSTRRGQTFTAVLWLLQALLWALATLAIAGYTGLVRKPA